MKRHSESGVALLSAILVLMLMSAMLVGFLALVNADQNASGVNRDQTQSYAAAHAGVEKLTSDLGQMFEQNFSPSGAQVNALVALTAQPNLGNGTNYTAPGGAPGSGYAIEFNDSNGDGNPDPEDPINGSPITDGVYAGLMGIITPYRMVVTARTVGGSEVRMRRTMQTVAIPVFQFGIFSDNDLSFFAGPNFNFGGRVHTNQNLFLAQGNGTTLTLTDRVTAVGDIVRTHLSNGELTGAGTNYPGTVTVARATNCATIPANCRNLATTEDSVRITSNPPVPPSLLTWVPGVVPAPGRWEMQRVAGNTLDPAWDGISRGLYNSFIRNGDTGARRLDLPIVDVSAGTTPIDLIKRPRAGDPSGAGTPFQERFFRLASIRVLLSDTAAEITGLPSVDNTVAPVNLAALVPNAGGYAATGAPIATSSGVAADGYRVNNAVKTVTGFIKIERQRPDGTFQDVTMRVLNLGIAGRNLSDGRVSQPDVTNDCPTEPFPDAIIRVQRLRDNPANGTNTANVYAPVRRCGNGSTVGTDYWPNVLYDSREGTRRETETGGNPYLSGVMHYVELDVNNLKKWLEGTSDGGFITANSTMNVTGYVLYFSDRRGNKNRGLDNVARTADDVETGEFGFEDIVTPLSATSVSDGNLQTGEDFNSNGALDVYGGDWRLNGNAAPLDATATVRTQVAGNIARTNPPTFFRRALKLVNGGQGQLPFVGQQGLTVASENPVYVQGNYNACGTMTADCAANGFGNNPGVDHVGAAVMADAVSLLSRNWNDIRSFVNPHTPGNRVGLTTWYRLGVISGKGISFLRPGSATGTDPIDFGTDGGAHNFLRFLEAWNGTLWYRGSIISLFNSRQGVGVYKCCNIVYSPPTRGYNFDADFLLPNRLPPRTPMFRDVNTLTFRQVLRPTQ
jgi:hypothetical protein